MLHDVLKELLVLLFPSEVLHMLLYDWLVRRLNRLWFVIFYGAMVQQTYDHDDSSDQSSC
jgi:hypothetical protein